MATRQPARSPADVDRLFAERMNGSDLDGVVALYEPTASFVPQSGDAVSGLPAIREALAGFMAMRPVLRMNVRKVVPAGGDLAVLYNDWSTRATPPGGDPMEVSGRALEIVRRQGDGTWRFVLDDPFGRG